MVGYVHPSGIVVTLDGAVSDGVTEYSAEVMAPDQTATTPEVVVGSGGEWSLTVTLDQPGLWWYRVAGTGGGDVIEGTLYCTEAAVQVEDGS